MTTEVQTAAQTAAEELTFPHPPRRIPFLGDVLGVNPRTPVQDSIRLGRQLGPRFERKVLGMRVPLVADPDLVAELSDESRFRKHLAPAVASLRGIGGDGLFTAYSDEPNWSKAHNLLQPAFTKNAMRSYHDTMVAVSRELIERWDARLGQPVDVSSDMTKLTLETIGRTGFSYSFDSFERDRPHPFVEAMVRALSHAQRSVTPIGRVLLGRKSARQHAADVDYLGSVVDEVIRTRRDADDTTGPDDLLGLMLRAARDGDPNRIDDVAIRHQVITFLVAGHETTSGALSFALYYLAQHPEIRARAQAEVDALWGEGDARPTFEQIPKLRYIRRVLDESLRLWPTAPAYAREAREDTTVLGRYRLRRGDWMLVFTPLLHRDPVWGPDADSFDPDRFLSERVRSRPPHVYKPFGTGERACIGRQFALHEAVLVLATILHRYEFHGEPDYGLRIQERLTLMPEGFRLRLESRRP